ncbi:hypothetical protein MNL76_08305, partial [Fervidobacterium riparium]
FDIDIYILWCKIVDITHVRMGVILVMKGGKKVFLVFILSTVLLLSIFSISSCTALQGIKPLPTEPVSDSTKLEPSDPRYAVELLAATETQQILEQAMSLGFAQKSFGFSTKQVNLDELPFDPSEVLSLLDGYEAFVKKIEEYLRAGAKEFFNHPNRKNYIIEVHGARKQKIFELAKKINPSISEPDKLYFDYRDFTISYGVLASLYYFYNVAVQNKNLAKAWEEVAESSGTALVNESAAQLISEIENELGKDPFALNYELLRNKFNQLLAIGNPKDFLNMVDVFKLEPFKLTNVKEVLDSLKWLVNSYLEIGDFENDNNIVTDKGFRKDGKETFTTLMAKAAETEECFVAKTVLEEPVDANFKINGKTPIKVKDILSELNDALPNKKKVDITWELILPVVTQESETEATTTLNLIMMYDFTKMYKEYIDYRDNNIGVKRGFFDEVFNDSASYIKFVLVLLQIFSGQEPTQENLEWLANLFLNNVPMINIDKQNKKVTLKFAYNNNYTLNDDMMKIELTASIDDAVRAIPSEFRAKILREFAKSKIYEYMDKLNKSK